MVMKNFSQELNALICDLVSLRNVSHQTCPVTGAKFVTLVEEMGPGLPVATRWRFDAKEGFVYCGGVC